MSGIIELEEYLLLMNETYAKGYVNQETVAEVFSLYDIANKGRISASEVRHALENSGLCLGPEELEKLMCLAEVDEEGMVDYQRFANMIDSSM